MLARLAKMSNIVSDFIDKVEHTDDDAEDGGADRNYDVKDPFVKLYGYPARYDDNDDGGGDAQYQGRCCYIWMWYKR